MGRLAQPNFLKRASAWLLGLALVTISAYAVQRTVLLHGDQVREDARREQQELSALIALWEGLITERIASWLVDLAGVPDIDLRERQLRGQVPWFNAYYLWEPGPDGPSFLYPRLAIGEDVALLLEEPCMQHAHGLAITGRQLGAAQAFERCSHEVDQPRRLLATSMGAALLLDESLADAALQLLADADPPLQFALFRAASRGLNTRRLIIRRQVAADALEATGDDARRENLLAGTVREIASLGGPELEGLLPTAERMLLDDLAKAPPELRASLEARLERAHRRLAGYRSVSERLAPGISASVGTTGNGEVEYDTLAHLRVVPDLYSDPGFLLAYAPLGDNRRVAAVQIEIDELLDALMDSGPMAQASDRLVVADAEGRLIRTPPGAPAASVDDVWFDVPFRRLMPRYSLGLLNPHREDRSQQWAVLAAQVAPIGIAFVIGLMAIAGRLTADRTQRELYDRQQAFIARVTHELKTPLAGIRVMAETMEMIAPDEQSAEFPKRIVQESVRLGQRIDEVLNVARKPEVSVRTPVVPHQLAAEAVEQWRPRFEQAGATLEAELRPCATIAADPALLRDALNNLLDNALKYLHEGRAGRCTLRTGEVGRWVVFEVTDNGIGVPSAMRKRIFERFTRVEGPGRGKSGGHGLGLSFVAEAAAAHGGLVECVEGPDGGARFRLKLRR